MNLPVITTAGVVCSVGLDVGAACAAIRCGLDQVVESRFHDGRSGWLPVAAIPTTPRRYGLDHWLGMLLPAVESCLLAAGRMRTAILVLTTGTEQSDVLIAELIDRLRQRFPAVIAVEPAAARGFSVLRQVDEVTTRLQIDACVIAGVDSLVSANAIAPLLQNGRLIGPTGTHHATVGEGAAAVLCQREGTGLHCLGVGDGQEPTTRGDGKPLRADGLTQAGRQALTEAGVAMHDIAWRIADCQMDQRALKEAVLVHRRLSQQKRESCPLWQPCRSTGLIGAATVPLLLAVAWMALRKGYAPGSHVLLHAGEDDGQRSVAVCGNARRVLSDEEDAA